MGSILKSTDGVSKFEIPGEGVVVVTFDDKKTTVAKIVKALEKGNFHVKGKPVYVKPGSSTQQGASPGASAHPQRELPLYTTFPDSSGAMPR
jgi:copper chaperone CopZ